MKQNQRYRVLIADTYSPVSMEIPHLFKKAGCEVDIFCFKNSWLKKNNCWNNWFEAGNIQDGTYARRLQALVEKGDYSWVVLSDDEAIRVANEAICNENLAKKILPLSKMENRLMLASKAGLSLLCQKYGILTPDFFLYEKTSDLKMMGDRLTYPLLLKEDGNGGGAGVYLCRNEPEVVSVLDKLSDEKKKNLIFQKYIFGDIICVEALYKNGQLLAYTYSKAVRTANNEFGPSINREYLACPEIEADLCFIGSTLGLNGFVTMTFMYCPQMKMHYLIEADMRPQSWFRLAKFCGVDFSKAIKNYITGEAILLRPVFKAGEVLTMTHFTRDVSRCFNEFDVRGFLKWVFNVQGCWRFIPYYDRKTLGVTLKSLARNAAGVCWRKLFKVKRNL